MKIPNRARYIVAFALLSYLAFSLFTRSRDPGAKILADQRRLCQSTFSDGDGPYYQPDAPFRNDLAPADSQSLHLKVRGKVFARGCARTAPNVVVDLWQADPMGVYQDTTYRGKIRADAFGNYSFETRMPRGYGVGTGYRPPHIHFKVWDHDRLIITSEMFFPDVVGWTDDAYISKVVKGKQSGNEVLYVYHDIILP
jgi:protocatechuate 3,4-dioxygenase beta subunit